MKQVSKTLALAVALTLIPLLLTNAPQGNASVPDFDPKNQFKVSILESEWSNTPSYLALRKTSKANRNDFETMLCPKWGEGDCVQTAGNHYYQYEGTVVLPVCAESSAVYCIEGLELKIGEGNWRKARFNRSIAGPVQTAVPEIGYPGGGTISLFETGEDAKSQDLDGYAIYASFELYPTAIDITKPRFERLDLRVTPYTRETGVFSEQTASTNVEKDGTKHIRFSGCGLVWCEASQRGRPTDFPKDVAARVTLRVPNALTGWLGGRLTKAEIGVTKIDATTNQLKIGGYPATVGRAVAILERASLPDNLPDYLKEFIINHPSIDSMAIRGSDVLSFGALDAIKDSIKDKSVSEETVWSLSSYRNSDTQCLQDDSNLVGLVTTNATAFAGVPPSFEGGILTYKIGGLHYDSKGGLTSGNYDLVIRSDVARCLYKFTKAPIQASISIAYETGEEKIATQVVNERDGWLHLGAYNFSYSAPTIRIKLTQDAVADSPTPSATPTPKIAIATPKKMSTITCIKGKTTKKITGAIPKCPAGYKKK